MNNIYSKTRKKSKKLYSKAIHIFPDGVTHDDHYLDPFPVYFDRADGPNKWDVDNNQYVDYCLGNGSLLLGHCHPEIVKATVNQIRKGTHFGGCHELETKWGKILQDLIPSADSVRFSGSGTEATMLAIRLARTATGKNKVLKFHGHFHGWHDAVMPGVFQPYESDAITGIPPIFRNYTISVPPVNIEEVEKILCSDNEIACIILEPTGGDFGRAPLPENFLVDLREVCNRYQIALIFDEVITGFRVSTGGVQERTGVLPDLTTLGKIVAGGLPGGAVVGKEKFMRSLQLPHLQPNDYSHLHTFHSGTFNANPISAAAGIACLSLIKSNNGILLSANAITKQLCKRLNLCIDRLGLKDSSWVYGDSSIFHILLGYNFYKTKPDEFVSSPQNYLHLSLESQRALSISFHKKMLEQGIDLMLGSAGFTSAAHTEIEIDKTVLSFENVLRTLIENGELVESQASR